MTIGEIIKEYRETHNLSQRKFAAKCNISSGYISLLEKGTNPKNNEPIVPSISALRAIASAMDLPFHELLQKVYDTPFDSPCEASLFGSDFLTVSKSDSSRTEEFTELFGQLTNEQQAFIIGTIKGILSNSKQ